MGERPLFSCALHEHRDRGADTLINENHENLFLIAKKNRAAAARRSHGAHLHFDDGLTHNCGSNCVQESAKLGANLPMLQAPGSYLDPGRWLTRGLRRDANRPCSLPPPLSNFGD